MRTGFRPADEKIPLAAPLDAAHGIDPDQPKAILPVPSSDVTKAILALWRQSKKHAQVALVLDCSGSMRVNQKMLNAQKGRWRSSRRWATPRVLSSGGDTARDRREHASQTSPRPDHPYEVGDVSAERS